MEPFLTIFTPTYNRKNRIVKLYNSLLNQKSLNFVWYIVDDGSDDGTKELIKSFTKVNKIKIKYEYIPNSGKMYAHNIAVSKTKTPLFVCVDSDDYVSNNFIEIIKKEYKKITKLKNIIGIVAYRKIANKPKNFDRFPSNVHYSTLSNLYKNGFKSETALIFKTEILKKFKFPVIKNEKFMTEAYIYDQIDRKYKYKVLRKYLIYCKYLNDGYTKNINKIKIKNPTSFALYHEQRARYSYSLKDIIKNYSYALAYNKIAKNRIKFKINLRLIFIPISYFFKNKIYNKIINYDY